MDRFRILSFAAALAIVAAACTSLPLADDARDQSTTTPERADDEALPSLLLVLDQDDAIVVVDQGGDVVERYDPPPDVRYVQPIWASADTFVSAQIAIDDNRLIARRVGGDEEWNVQFTTAPFYYLARVDTEETTVVSLRNNDEAAGLIAEIVDGSGLVDAVSDESPFYMSWEPGSGRLATHVGGDRLDILDGSAETISTSAGGFQAPVWLDRGLATLRTSSGETFLSIWDGSSFADLAAVRSAARFVGAGDRIAIQTGAAPDTGGIQAFARAQAPATIPAGILTVIDIGAGTFTSVTSEVSPFYQWDSGGRRLLFSTLVSDPEPALVWHVWENGEIQDFAPFAPDPTWFQSVVPFFDQYAQSISLWSPDGSAFAYPALVDGEPRILIQELDKASPRDIAGGFWVTWAPRTDDR
jgi:hypothetical protein